MIRNFWWGSKKGKRNTLGTMGSDVFSQDGWGYGLSRFRAI
jgi:hypothetical protein